MSELKNGSDCRSSPLLSGNKNQDRGDVCSGKNRNRGDGQKIGFISTMVLSMATGQGAAIIILPNDLKNLGPVIFVIYTFFIVLLLTFIGVLTKEIFTCMVSLTKNENRNTLTITKLSSIFINSTFGVIIQVIFYIVMALVPISCLIVSATLLRGIIPMSVPYYQGIRIWLVPCFIIITPLTFIQSIAQTQKYTLIGVAACIMSTATLYCVCLYHSITQRVTMSDFLDTDDFAPAPDYFRTFGHLLFLSPNIYLPMLIINYSKPKLFELPLFLSTSLLFCTIALSASIPYAAFRQEIEPNLFDTLQRLMTQKVVMYWLLFLARLLLAIYFMICASIPLIVLFQNIESAVSMPKDMTYIKALSHIALMAFLLAAALLFPFMEPMITLTGSFPICVIGISIPILLYYFMADRLSLCMKIVLVTVGIATFLSSLVTTYFSLRELLVLFNKEYYEKWHQQKVP
eukprot:TCONS_00009100-protein